MSSCSVMGCKLENVYAYDDIIAPEEIEKVHEILSVFKPDTEFIVSFDTMWSESKEEYVTRLTEIEVFISFSNYFTVYNYNLTRDKV